jgi:sialate O-acetylesterase
MKHFLFFLFLFPLGFRAIAQVKLPRLVRDSMVLQRESPVKIWGWAAKGEKVTVRFNGRQYKTITGADGKWSVLLPPMKAGGPYTMDISASNIISLKDILIGDVWVCAGQSNMVHQMELHKETYAQDIAQANYPAIRHFFIPTLTDLTGPREDLPSGYWKAANPEDVRQFSVVAYFFAKAIHEKTRVPIGLINASVGGTPIEAWTSEAGLKEFPSLLQTIEKNKDTAYVNSLNRAALTSNQAINQNRPPDKGLTGKTPWHDTAFTPQNWRTINIPGYWEDQGIKAQNNVITKVSTRADHGEDQRIQDMNGIVWYRKEIEVPATMTGIPAKIYLGRIVDADYLYVNGNLVGNTTYQYPQRRYQLPAGLLKPGKNVLVIRVINYSGKGGFVPDKPYYLTAGGQTIDLNGYWQYKVGVAFPPQKQVAGISAQNQPAALFNAMVAPLVNYAIKGILWYQGESNAGRPKEYAKLLPALIKDWRQQWKQGDVPFLYVQLPNYMEVAYLPTESNWALMREAQLKALSVPYTGMAVAIDLGEWNDIHPRNKKDVGLRLALAARKVTYGEDLVYSGPLYQSSKVEGDKVVITFSNSGSGLVTNDGEALSEFAIAGADKKFVWANAKINGNTVEVWSKEVPAPVYVRYAWADNPDNPNLYNKEGLPASPFRTDQ